MMKVKVVCPGCKGAGRLTLTRAIPDYCGIGTSPCAQCNGTGYLERPATNADFIRSMSDKELAAFLYQTEGAYCTSKPECGAMLDSGNGIPDERCVACLLHWLRQPAKEF